MLPGSTPAMTSPASFQRFVLTVFLALAVALPGLAMGGAAGTADPLAQKFEAGLGALAQGDFPRAYRLMTELINTAGVRPKDLSRFFDARGVVNYRTGQNLEAYEDFGRAITLDPGNATAHNNRGTLFFVTADYGRALAEFDTALNLRPDYAVAWEGRAMTLQVIGKHGDARRSFRKAHDLGRRTPVVIDGIK